MCGILGGNNAKWDYHKGIECMRHRGPDGIRVCNLQDFTLAFARLSIIDLSEKAMQPMFTPDKQVGIVFNGEIYGYQNLRNDLLKKGYHFISSSDTEVVLNAYLEWGEDFITRVDGMYGMAIYDKRDGKIKLYRDRVGIKPIYYYYDGINFGFASELKGIVQMCNDIAMEIDNTAVYDYLNYFHIPAPKTYYKRVYKLLPGHKLIFDIKSKKIIQDDSYWRLHINTRKGKQRKQNDLIEELQYLMQESVQEQMVADVPVGTFLSGGVDSSIITYEGHKINPEIETFTMGFTDIAYDELKFAAYLTDRYNIRTNTRVFKKVDFEQYVDKMKDWYDEPFGVTNACPAYLVSCMAKEKVSVALSGDGGDEIFGGYTFYRKMWERERENIPDNILLSKVYRKFRKSGELDYYCLDDLDYIVERIDGIRVCIDETERRERLKIPKDYDKYWAYRRYYNKELPAYTRMMYMDMKVRLPGRICTQDDRISMAVSLETRVPFLSRKLIEFSFALSEEDRCPNGEPKGLLKKAYEREFGANYVYRNKKGFDMPANYFEGKTNPQEYILQRVWGEKCVSDRGRSAIS